MVCQPLVQMAKRKLREVPNLPRDQLRDCGRGHRAVFWMSCFHSASFCTPLRRSQGSPSVLQPQFPHLWDEGGGLGDLIPWPAPSGSVTDRCWICVLERVGTVASCVNWGSRMAAEGPLRRQHGLYHLHFVPAVCVSEVSGITVKTLYGATGSTIRGHSLSLTVSVGTSSLFASQHHLGRWLSSTKPALSPRESGLAPGLPLPAPLPGAAATLGPGFEAAPTGASWLCTLCDPLTPGQGAFQILCAQNEMGPLFILILPPK